MHLNVAIALIVLRCKTLIFLCFIYHEVNCIWILTYAFCFLFLGNLYFFSIKLYRVTIRFESLSDTIIIIFIIISWSSHISLSSHNHYIIIILPSWGGLTTAIKAMMPSCITICILLAECTYYMMLNILVI